MGFRTPTIIESYCRVCASIGTGHRGRRDRESWLRFKDPDPKTNRRQPSLQVGIVSYDSKSRTLIHISTDGSPG